MELAETINCTVCGATDWKDCIICDGTRYDGIDDTETETERRYAYDEVPNL